MTKTTFPETTPSQSADSAPCACAEQRTKIACDLTVFTPAERDEHLARTKTIFAALTAVSEVPDGFVFAFASTPSRRAEIAHWIEAEQRCCPFYRFEVRDEDNRQTLVLGISGPPGAKAVLRAGMEAYGRVTGAR